MSTRRNDNGSIPSKMSKPEKSALIIIALMVAFWIYIEWSLR